MVASARAAVGLYASLRKVESRSFDRSPLPRHQAAPHGETTGTRPKEWLLWAALDWL